MVTPALDDLASLQRLERAEPFDGAARPQMQTLLNRLAAIALLVRGTHIVRTGVLRLLGTDLRKVLERSVQHRSTSIPAPRSPKPESRLPTPDSRLPNPES